MAKLTSNARKKLPAKDFAGPGRSFPIEDKNHARAALSMVGRSSISPAAKAKVRAKARAKLGETGGMATHRSMRGHGVNDDRPMYRTNPTK